MRWRLPWALRSVCLGRPPVWKMRCQQGRKWSLRCGCRRRRSRWVGLRYRLRVELRATASVSTVSTLPCKGTAEWQRQRCRRWWQICCRWSSSYGRWVSPASSSPDPERLMWSGSGSELHRSKGTAPDCCAPHRPLCRYYWRPTARLCPSPGRPCRISSPSPDPRCEPEVDTKIHWIYFLVLVIPSPYLSKLQNWIRYSRI